VAPQIIPRDPVHGVEKFITQIEKQLALFLDK
jgi:hypothetical protein